jgi:hypothetical protein
MIYSYGDAFERLGVPGMGFRGADWCSVDPRGVLVLMGHENYVMRRNGVWVYETPVNGIAPPGSGRAASRSRALLESYFAMDKPIILIVARFGVDGHFDSEGRWINSVFKEATGDAYKGRMQRFSQAESYLLCHLDQKLSF